MRKRTFKYKKRRFMLKTVIHLLMIMIGLMTSIYVLSFLLGPPPLSNQQNTVYYSENGKVIGEEKGTERRYNIELEKMSPYIIKAIIAVEDKNFYAHQGFDVKRIIRAATSNIQSLSKREGASTLTQQYARNLYLTHEKTWLRKAKEAFYTIRLEMHYSKAEIMEGYLNTIYFGHGAYGIEAASKHLFNKQASDVSLAEAAMLVAIPKGPTYYSPLNDEVRATKRQQHILSLLHQQQKISEQEYTAAIKEELVYMQQIEEKQGIGPHFQDTALTEAANILNIDKESIRSSGYKIYTTLNQDLQKKLEQQIKRNIKQQSDIEVGAITLNPSTGSIEALVGGRSYDKSPFNRAIAASRMSGSTFKPFLYYAALEKNYTPSTKLMSKPTTFILDDDETYAPSNFNGYYANEPITLAQALALSDNIYAVKTNLFLGIGTLAATAKEFGITSTLPEVPSLALGTASVTVKEITAAYGVLANGGKEVHPYTIEKIIDRYDKVVYERKDKKQKQILDVNNAFILTHLLTGMFDTTLNGYMSVTGSAIADQLTYPYAGKSGTTKADSWMIGYSPTLVTGIWTGYDNNRPMEITAEAAYAKDIWAGFMEAAHNNKAAESFPIPAGVTGVLTDPATGQIATAYCPESRLTYYKKGTEPRTHCMTHFPTDEEMIDQIEETDNKDAGFLQRLFELLDKH